ncbi:MAG: PAS domain-containing protein [Desulfohalobiaceae bacterium]|nr:PAS domain-containing protein [Desulfohalobiaceae bacterium]
MTEDLTYDELKQRVSELEHQNELLQSEAPKYRTFFDSFPHNDITTKKQTEDALQKSRQELQRTLDATTDGIWTWNFTTNDLFFSPKYYAMLGYSPEDFPANFENWMSLIHPDDLEEATAKAKAYLETKNDTYENEFRMRTKGGEYRWIHASGRVVERDAKGNALYMIGSHEDITGRKQAEEELRDNEERLSLALDGGNLGTWDWNIQTGEVAFDERWASMKGYPLSEIQPHLDAWKNLLHPDDLPDVMEKLQAHLQGKTDTYEAEFRILGKNGEWLWISDRGKVLQWDEKGNPLRACGIHLDITENKRAEEAL